MEVRSEGFIDGRFTALSGRELSEVRNPATEEVIANVTLGDASDAARAIEAAHRALPSWAALPAKERVAYTTRIAEALTASADAIGALITSEVGMPLRLSTPIQVGLPISTFTSMESCIQEVLVEEQIENSLVVREPVGVVAGITPWNYPLHQIAAKVAPALAAGCTIVLKPSEIAPLNAFRLAEIVAAIGLPAGVFNLVPGTGPVVGEALASDVRVDLVSFTGSPGAGRRVAELASQHLARVTLELGGKSASVVLDGADLSRAVKATVSGCFLNSGQTCSALTRLVVPRHQLQQIEELVLAEVARYVPGDPMAERTRLGPVVSARQRERVRSYIRSGIAEGARLCAGGEEPPEGLGTGFFVRPTVFSEVRPEMAIAREEIFGPVLSILAYDGEDEAADLANATDYGLSGAVFAADRERAITFARRMRTGQVDINGGAFNPLAPFGGYRHSGYGRELGRFGLEEYLEVKSLQL